MGAVQSFLRILRICQGFSELRCRDMYGKSDSLLPGWWLFGRQHGQQQCNENVDQTFGEVCEEEMSEAYGRET